MFKKALLTLSLFFCLVILSFHGVTSAAEWSEMDPGQDINNMDIKNDFYSVWGSGADNVYVVGTFGIKLKYDGNPEGTWKDQGDHSGWISALWGSSASNIFGVCHDADIVHYDGTDWYAMAHTVTPREFLKGVWGSSATDVYAVGENSMIMHYDGSEWESMNSGITDLGIHLYGVWGSSATNIYAVGVAGTILHFDGFTWSDDDVDSGTEETLRAIWGSAEDDIYCVGDRGTIIHYDGENWSAMESATTNWLLGVWGTSGTNVYAVGGDYDGVSGWFHPDSWDGGAILHYDGNSWSEIKTDIDNRLFSIWGSSEDDIFTVGAQGTILRYGDPLDEEKCFFENLYKDNVEKLASLRNVRDDFLNTSLQGKLVIRSYYTLSPYLVKLLKHNIWLRSGLEKSIDIFLPSLGVVND